MAGGKRVEGLSFALRCAVFGQPPAITPLEELYLLLNVETGRAVQTHSVVEGMRIASGKPGPWEYYLMLAGNDNKLAARLQARAMLMEMMNG